jgi:hypothetical protein
MSQHNIEAFLLCILTYFKHACTYINSINIPLLEAQRDIICLRYICVL